MGMQRVDDKGNQIDISKEVAYKFEVGANRYDLLCVEGLASTLRCYLGLGSVPRLSIKNRAAREMIFIRPETQSVRPYVVGAILRNIKFDV